MTKIYIVKQTYFSWRNWFYETKNIKAFHKKNQAKKFLVKHIKSFENDYDFEKKDDNEVILLMKNYDDSEEDIEQCRLAFEINKVELD